MIAKLTNSPKTLMDAIEALDGKSVKVIGPNTALTRQGQTIVATFHGNEIVRYDEGGVSVNFCGWVTAKTTERINQLAPGRYTRKLGVPQHNGVALPEHGWTRVY